MLNELFFAEVRRLLFNGRLSQKQVDGMNIIFDTCLKHIVLNRSWVAYILATAFHETDGTMEPIREYGGPRYFFRMYDMEGERPKVARELGNDQPGDGALFHGRGFAQLTGRRNYLFQGNKHGLNLVGTPDLVMETDVAAEILVGGMLKGDFTGKSLANCTPIGDRLDFVEARRIINGRDRAEDIAQYAELFGKALGSVSELKGVVS